MKLPGRIRLMNILVRIPDVGSTPVPSYCSYAGRLNAYSEYGIYHLALYQISLNESLCWFVEECQFFVPMTREKPSLDLCTLRMAQLEAFVPLH